MSHAWAGVGPTAPAHTGKRRRVSVLGESGLVASSLARRAIPQRRDLLVERLRQYAPLAMLLTLSLIVGVLNPRFFTWDNFVNIAAASAVPLIVGAALT